jgi:hypothetical protein
MAAKPFENRTKKSGFQLVASLDRFIKKILMNKIFFMPKWSRLEVKKLRSGFQMVKTKWRPFDNRTKKVSEK